MKSNSKATVFSKSAVIKCVFLFKMNLLVLLGRKHLFLQFGQIHCSTMQAVRGQVEKLLFKYCIIKLVLTPMVLLFFLPTDLQSARNAVPGSGFCSHSNVPTGGIK